MKAGADRKVMTVDIPGTLVDAFDVCPSLLRRSGESHLRPVFGFMQPDGYGIDPGPVYKSTV